MGFFDSLFGKKQERPKPETTAAKEGAFTLPEEYRDLTPRDTRKPKAYFAEVLYNGNKHSKLNISTYNEYVANNNPVGIRNYGYMLCQQLHIHIYGEYNIGKPITKEWVDFYKEYFEFFISSIDDQSVFDDNFRVIGIGILLGVEASYFQKISEKFIAEGYKDYILDTLIASQYPEHPVSKTVLYPDDVMIRHLVKVIDTADKDAAQHLIKDHLDNAYYTKAVLEDEYNSHKRDDGLYNGYWSIDSAVLVKIKGLDDSSFKDNPYYPQDLVHWQNT